MSIDFKFNRIIVPEDEWDAQIGSVYGSQITQVGQPIWLPNNNPFVLCVNEMTKENSQINNPTIEDINKLSKLDTLEAAKTVIDGYTEYEQALLYRVLYLMGMRIDKAEAIVQKQGRK